MSQPAPDAAKQNQLRLLRALDEATAKLEAAERARTEPIAIVGLACRFPGGVRDAASCWRALRDGVDAIGPVPADRWDAEAYFDAKSDAPGKIGTRAGGFLEEVDRFDAEFFGVAPREAAAMDPQQRLLVEVAHEALDSAGQLNDRLADNATGVFVGLTNNDYAHLLKRAAADRPLDQYFVTGNAPNAAAGRISYLLGLRGPSLVVDSACSSSLVTVHLACQSLRAGDCRVALAGGANLILSPEASIALSRARMLAPDGRCKTFDDAADGYGRGEGVGLLVLKRLADAQRAGDRVLALIRGSAVNQDGPTSGFTVPSGAAQRTLLRAALEHARLAPADIDYVEAHGTGTALGDPIEIGALAEVLGAGRAPERPLLVGSVKTNFGHLESAAGVAGLIKAVLALWHGEIPAHLHFRNPSRHVAWDEIPVRVASTRLPWPATDRPRRAGVSSFGVSGTNAHVVLEQAPAELAARELPGPHRRFRGERHWVTPPAMPALADGGAKLRDMLYAVAWEERPRRARAVSPVAFTDAAAHATAVHRWLADARMHPGGAAYAAVLPRLEALSRLFARQALRDVKEGDVAVSRRRLWVRVQALAAEADDATSEPTEATVRLLAECPEARVEITLLSRCGGRLADVLRDACDPLTLLFPPDEPVTAADLYQRTPVARRMNELVATVVRALGPVVTPGPLRVLELGAGTGGTTAALLAALPAGVEYVFTDVSPLFVAQARERFRDTPALRTQVLDLECDPLAQGFAAGEFDLVIAANVLHATRDLRTTLRHVRSLLAARGRLVLLEAAAPLGFLDLIFGLTDGWWRFEDVDLRPRHALLAPKEWQGLLERSGFDAVEAFSFSPEGGEIFAQQAVIIAGAEGTAPSAQAPGNWLLFADRQGVARAVGAALEIAGGTVRFARGDTTAEVAGAATWRGVVDCRALDADDPLDAEPLRGALALTHALIARPAPVWFVTGGAVAADARDTVPGVAQAGLWGFARTLAQEHPELRPMRIDLDPAVPVEESGRALVAELLHPEREDQVAWRGDARLVARLVRVAADQPAQPLRVSGEGVYLVVGGLGGLGRPLAHWLAKRGARHLVIAGRSAPDEAAQALFRELAGAGVQVVGECADVSVEADVARVLANMAAKGRPLRGVIHAAGVLDDGVVSELNWERFARVLGPKVAGAWHLHRLTRTQPLDFFVMFSSATGLLGSPGQANHAAANVFLDALAHHRHATGLPALSIDWGAWAGIGAAARRQVAERIRLKGVGTIAPDDGWQALERLMTRPVTQMAVLPVDWTQVPPALVASGFFTRLRASAPTWTPTESALAATLPAVPPAERRARLGAEVRRQVAQVLGLSGPEKVGPQQGFFTLGMDSLTSVELRNRLQAVLGRPLPSTLVFDYPTADVLAEFLGAFWDNVGPAASDGAPRPITVSPAGERPREIGAEPIAIIGLGLRFPGGVDSPESFWRLLREKVDAITEVPPDRWDVDEFFDPDPAARGKMYVRSGGFVADIDRFDAAFFGVSPREAAAMDPQQRLLLEVSWEALEHAGIAPDALAGSRTGVFVGISNHDYMERLLASGVEEIDSYVGSGNAHSVAAGRLSYALGLQGPCLAVDTACSSSLVAVHLACSALRNGECALALAGGVNLLLSPTISINHSRARMLAPDGRCKSFDAAADGFSRSDGCGVVALKRLSDAQREGDRVQAVIRGSAVNQDGRTSGLTVPSGPSQQAVMRTAWEQTGLAPAAATFIEAHGTGTSLGDPIEMGALAAVFGPGRGAASPLFVGSVKSNFGHCESAAGVAGLIKAVLSIVRGEIPAHLHFRDPNPLIPWAELPYMRVTTEPVPWPAGQARVAGVSSFGFGGTNAHVVVAEPPAPAIPANAPTRPGEVLVLSAKNDNALRELASRYAADLNGTEPGDWPNVCHTAATGRAALSHRLAFAAASPVEASATLTEFTRGQTPRNAWSGRVGERPTVAFLFSGQGSLYAGMGRELHATCPAYREAFEECRALVQQRAGWDLAAVVDSGEKLALTEFGQVALFAVEYALARAWIVWGLVPDAVAGHSVGEYAAACVAGAWSTEEALKLLIARARLMGALGDLGAMAAVQGTEAEVAGLVARHGVEFGAINSPRQIVLTGARPAVEAAVAELHATGVRAQLLEVRQGYHSRQMEPMLEEFGRTAAATAFGELRGKFVSSVTGRLAANELVSADYWVRQVRAPVRFADALRTLHTEKIDLVLEVGPRGILAALGQQTWPAGEGEWLLSLRPGHGEWAQMLESTARAWVRGAPVAWHEVDRGFARRCVALPTYPFQRQRHWCAEPARVEPTGPTFEIAWEPIPAARQAGARSAEAWCLVSGSEALRRNVARELTRRSRRVAGAVATADEGVLFLADSVEASAAGAAAACERLRLLARELCAAGTSARLWIVTRGAMAAAPGDGQMLALAAAPLWGFGKAFALEHPENFGAMINLPAAAMDAEVERLVDECLAPSGEEQLAWRGGEWLAARLRPRELPAGRITVRADGAYLITGGLGALGLRVADWLVGRGATHLALVGRRPPSAMAKATLASWRARGANVTTHAVDVADADAMRALVLGLTSDGRPIHGVVHAAGVAGFQLLDEFDAGSLALVLRPKIAGAWALHEAVQGQPLNFFVLFSSIAAVWGSKGQAHYAAANQFLDALAHYRSAVGLPALSINWGPWAGGGMATDQARAQLGRVGVGLLAPPAALGVLENALAAGARQIVTARIDWTKFLAVFESRGSRGFFSLIKPTREESPTEKHDAPPPPMLPAELARLDESARPGRLREHVQTVVAQVLRLPDGELPEVRQGFSEMGIDSLLAVEIRNRLAVDLGATLPATLVFDHPDVERLARHLLTRIDDAVPMAAPAPSAPEDTALAATRARVAQMTEEEAEELLLKKLEQL